MNFPFHHLKVILHWFRSPASKYAIFFLTVVIGDNVDYETVISEKFPNCDVEVLSPDVFELEQLIEYITDDIIVYGPHSILVYRHMIRFLMNVGERGKIYYLENFSDDDLEMVHAGLLKFTWGRDVKINLFKNSNPDKDVLGL